MGNVGIAAHRDTFFRPLREICPKPHASMLDKINPSIATAGYRTRAQLGQPFASCLERAYAYSG